MGRGGLPHLLFCLAILGAVFLPSGCSRANAPAEGQASPVAATAPTPAGTAAALAAEALARLGQSGVDPNQAKLPDYVRLNLGRMADDPWRMSDAEIKLAHHPQPKDIGQPAAGMPRVKLSWRTQRESNPFGFFVYRADDASGSKRRRLNPGAPLLAERGFTETPHEYVFYDLDVTTGQTYFYRILAIDMAGKLSWIVGATEVPSASPKPLTAAEVEEIAISGPAYRVTLQ